MSSCLWLRRVALIGLIGSSSALWAMAGQTSGVEQAPYPSVRDEFVGPFSSWRNARTDYGAKGDGIADDTAALQSAFDDLVAEDAVPILFIPQGTYRITRTLHLRFAINRGVVGEDPLTTSLVWDGEAGGTMFHVNGLAYSRFVRLTFDGRRKASVAVEQSWDGSRAHFDTGNEYSDDRFVDVEFGIRGGFMDRGFAETSILRSHFLRNTKAGIAHGNFNALDTWVWDSLFEDCGTGVTNGGGAGNFHVYRSIFKRSAVTDLFMGHTGGFSARWNYSIDSQAFFASEGATNNPATIALQGNRIIDPRSPTAISFGNQGPGVLLDNVVRSRGPEGPVVDWRSFLAPDVLAAGNTFTVPETIRTNGRLVSFDERVVDRDSVDVGEPAFGGALPDLHRAVFEVTPDSSAAAVQAVIDAAARAPGSRPVVHFPVGEFSIDRTLDVPASDIQFVGDGGETVLRWSGEDGGPVFRLQGPSRVTFRDLLVDGDERADGIVVDGADQSGGRVYGQQLNLRGASQVGLLVAGLDHTRVEMEDFGHAQMPDGVMVKVVGGPRQAGGEAIGGTAVHSGAASGGPRNYEVTGGGRLLVRDLWYEAGGAAPGFALIHGAATFTADGLRVAPAANPDVPAFDIVDLDGRATMMATHTSEHIRIRGGSDRTRVLGAAIFCDRPFIDCFRDEAHTNADSGVINSRQIARLPGTRSVQADDSGSTGREFLREMLAHARSEVARPLRAVGPGRTDLRFFRVWIEQSATGLTIRP